MDIASQDAPCHEASWMRRVAMLSVSWRRQTGYVVPTR